MSRDSSRDRQILRSQDGEIRIGISSCLLGRQVRYDAGHKRDRYITDVLGEHFTFVPVCPELEIGMGVPREAVRLEGDPVAPVMIGVKSRTDWTDAMNHYAQARIRRRDLSGISGYILKKDSPSCGMERVRLYGKNGQVRRITSGLFAAALVKHNPLLPVEEEGRLNDAHLRENFIVRVFAYHRLQNLFSGRHKASDIVRFHTTHKYLLLSHSPRHYSELGRLVAGMKSMDRNEFRESYGIAFSESLKIKATTAKHTNVLLHIVGFLKNRIDAADKTPILAVIEDYRKGIVPLVVPITLVRHFVDRFEIEYIRDQVYLNPHPKELALRNHV